MKRHKKILNSLTNSPQALTAFASRCLFTTPSLASAGDQHRNFHLQPLSLKSIKKPISSPLLSFFPSLAALPSDSRPSPCYLSLYLCLRLRIATTMQIRKGILLFTLARSSVIRKRDPLVIPPSLLRGVGVYV
jgi:hypothetical protein